MQKLITFTATCTVSFTSKIPVQYLEAVNIPLWWNIKLGHIVLRVFFNTSLLRWNGIPSSPFCYAPNLFLSIFHLNLNGWISRVFTLYEQLFMHLKLIVTFVEILRLHRCGVLFIEAVVLAKWSKLSAWYDGRFCVNDTNLKNINSYKFKFHLRNHLSISFVLEKIFYKIS